MICCGKKTPIKDLEMSTTEATMQVQKNVEKIEVEQTDGCCCSTIKCQLPSCPFSVSNIFSALSYVALIKVLVSMSSYLYDLASRYQCFYLCCYILFLLRTCNYLCYSILIIYPQVTSSWVGNN